MEVSWSVRFHHLPPDAQIVIRACAVLDRSSLSQHVAAAVMERDLSRAGEVFAALAGAGWGAIVDDQFDVEVAASAFLYQLVRQTPLDDLRAVIERIAALAETLLSSAAPLPTGARGNALAVLRAANRYEMPQVTLRVVHAAWGTVAPDSAGADTGDSGIGMDWWRGVAEEGEQAASRTRQPRLLADLLDRSARLHSLAGDWQGAETALIRALYLMNRLGDRDEYDRYLEQLAKTYHDADQPAAFVTTLEELVDRYEHDRKPDLAASALARIGTTLFNTAQFGSAIRYLGQADRLLAGLPETNELRIRRAEILSDMGRAYVSQDSINNARICYHDALVLVVDIDQEAEQRIRALQTSLPQQEV